METFVKYKIVDNNLFLTENLYWQFKPHRRDSIKEWELLNVDKADLSKNKLEKLISYEADSEIEVERIANRKRLTIRFHLDNQEFSFNCDNIYQEERPLNVGELTDIILRHEKNESEHQSKISEHNKMAMS